jgi:hypothetical protein
MDRATKDSYLDRLQQAMDLIRSLLADNIEVLPMLMNGTMESHRVIEDLTRRVEALETKRVGGSRKQRRASKRKTRSYRML